MDDKRVKGVKWKCHWGWHERRTREEKNQHNSSAIPSTELPTICEKESLRESESSA